MYREWLSKYVAFFIFALIVLASCKPGGSTAGVVHGVKEATPADAETSPDPLFLPGTQPGENGIELAKVEQCKE